jgi:PAS domain S-box-containing protein
MITYQIFILLAGVVIVVIGALVIWGMARRYRRDLGIRMEPREKSTETAFIINAFHDLTKQLKQKEKELERLKVLAEHRAANVESYNENILQCVTNGVMTFDRDCRLTTINRAAEEILGMQREGSSNRSCAELFGDNEISRAVRDAFEKGQQSARMEAVLDRSGGKIWLGFNTAILTDRKGAALGVILSFSDLTAIKRLQEQVELRERLTALGEMSAGIAHELRNPMAVISGYLNLLSKKANNEHQAIIQNITTEISGMNRIIGDLLTFARPASLNRVKVNIRELMEGCLASALQATGAGASIRTEVNLDSLEVFLDEAVMRQALTNLIQNAVEAMPDGGTLSLSTVVLPDKLKIIFKDSGTGISPDAINKVFLPFFTTKDSGVGMGLALAHKIIVSHGGRIEVASTVGKGTVFTVVLPIG